MIGNDCIIARDVLIFSGGKRGTDPKARGANRKAEPSRNDADDGEFATAGQALDAGLQGRILSQIRADRIDAGKPAGICMGGETKLMTLPTTPPPGRRIQRDLRLPPGLGETRIITRCLPPS